MPAALSWGSAATLKEHLLLQGEWRARAVRAIHDLHGWLCTAGDSSAETDARLRQALAMLETEQYLVAVAGASKRGKTELINALFFADCGRPLLPTSEVDSVCPIEIQWEAADGDACLRLLPIETRSESHSIDALKLSPERWLQLPLHPKEPEQIRTTLAQIHDTKELAVARAERLGLAGAARLRGTDRCAVPCWRYAVLRFPHPLLRRGLVLLDLPAPAAMARDPALYRRLLSRADALLLAVAADRGVEAADLALWQTHLADCRSPNQPLLVALTRSDLLARNDAHRGAKLVRLRQQTATALDIDPTVVHMVSARDGLTARIADKPARLRASGIDVLELRLAEQLTKGRRHTYRAAIDLHIGKLLGDGVEMLSRRAAEVDARARQIKELQARSEGLAALMLKRTRHDGQQYLQAVQHVQSAQQALRERAAHCRRLLDAGAFEHMLANARERLYDGWHTGGMRRIMRALFDEVRVIVAQCGTDAPPLQGQVAAAYARLQADLDLTAMPPRVFTLGAYRNEMDLLHAEAMRFASSGEMLFTTRGAAIARFERGPVQRARVLLEHLRDDWDRWTQAAMGPAIAEIDHRKAEAQQRLKRYQQLKATREDARTEAQGLARERVQTAKQLTLLRNIRNSLDHEPSVEDTHAAAPYLVTSGGEPVRRSG